MKHFLLTILTVVVVVAAILVPLTVGIGSVQLHNSQRESVVTSCEAANRTTDGIERLVEKLRSVTPPAQRAQAEGFYRTLLDAFPRLDCRANPIKFR